MVEIAGESFRLHLDVDIKSDTNTMTEEQVLQHVMPGIREVVKERFPNAASPLVVTGVASHFTLITRPEISWKYGFHLIWPNIITNKQQHNRFVLAVGEYFRSKYGEGLAGAPQPVAVKKKAEWNPKNKKLKGRKEQEKETEKREEEETYETVVLESEEKDARKRKEEREKEKEKEEARETSSTKEGSDLPAFFTRFNTWTEIFDTASVSNEYADMRFVSVFFSNSLHIWPFLF